MEEEALWDRLIDAGLTEQEIEEIMGLGALTVRGQMSREAGERAQALRQSPLPRGRWTGRVYRSAHPLEFVSSGVDRVVGALEGRQQLEEQRRIADEQSRLRSKLLRHMMQKQQNPPAAPVAPGSMSPITPGTGNPMTEALRRIDPYQLR